MPGRTAVREVPALWLGGQLSFNLKIEEGTHYQWAAAGTGRRRDVVPGHRDVKG